MIEPLLDIYGEQGFRLTFPYSPQMVAQVRQALGFTFDKRSRSWVCEGPEAVLDLQRFNIIIHATDAAIARFQQFRQQLDHILDLKAWNPGEDLYAFQQVGTEVLAGQYKGVLGDSMGLGKSKQALDACAKVGAKHILIVAPKSLVYNWKDEIEKWQPEWHATVVPDKAVGTFVHTIHAPAEEPVVAIANYEKIRMTTWPSELKWDAVILDEITRAKNTRTRTHKALRKIVKQAKYVFALTGTPLEMKVEELYGIMALVRPAVFGSFMRFRDQHLITNFFGQVVGSKNHQLLKERVGPWMTRRTKDEVLTQLPAKLYNDIWVQFTDDEAKEYAQIADNFEAWLTEREEDFTAANALTQLLRLQQFTSSPDLLSRYDAGLLSIDADQELDVWKGSKYQELEDLIAEWEGRVVVFTRFEQMAQRLMKWLGNSPLVPIEGVKSGFTPKVFCHHQALISGNVSAQDRVERIKWFNAGHLGQVLVSTDAGAYGLNITGADLVVHYDMLWNPGRMWQREDRLHRIGQTHTVNVVRLVVKGTVDAGMLGILTKREELFRDIVDGAEEAALLKFGKAMLRRVARGEAA